MRYDSPVSGWALPSAGELRALSENLPVVRRAMEIVGGDPFSDGQYLSSSQDGATSESEQMYYFSVSLRNGNYAQRAAVAAETKVSEWINDVIRFVGELIFQMSYYGILVAQRIFLTILAVFAPIMFALSIVPPWSSAWSQWISKYLSLSLWGFVVYMCLYYIDFILLYNLQEGNILSP